MSRALATIVRGVQPPPAEVSREEFHEEFNPDVMALPHTTCLLGFSQAREQWLVHGFVDGGGHSRERLDPLTRFVDRHVRRHLERRSFWLFFNHWDAWRERDGEDAPLSRSRDWVACFGARRGDRSALVVPEAHYLRGRYYRPLLARLALERIRWDAKRPRAIFAGGDHGATESGPTPRRQLRSVVNTQELPVEVHLGERVPRRAQMAYKYLLDVDGWVRTWDAWAWKLASGSVVLSPASDWVTFFTELFAPWEHFVPVAQDFSDLAERLEWCREHDRDCREIARRARSRVHEVYRPAWAGARLARTLGERLGK